MIKDPLATVQHPQQQVSSDMVKYLPILGQTAKKMENKENKEN